jgi:DNA-binding NarL/FixJ family response regulator
VPAVNGRAAVAAASALAPDIVLMDIRMPELDGIQATAAICADPALASTRVLILTTFEEDEYLVDALHAGDALLSPVATRILITRYALPPEPSPTSVQPELEQLTEREREVLLLVARGRSNQEIADELFISPHTAKTHVNRIMTKVPAHDRAQLVILAYESGLLAPGTG